MAMLRYRYKNTSPKRQDWEGAHHWVKGHKRERPIRRRHLPVVASVTWRDPNGHATLGADLYTVEKGAAFWKASIAGMVQADKEAVGGWAPKPSVALPGEKFLAAERRRFNAMVGTDSEWCAYQERKAKSTTRRIPHDYNSFPRYQGGKAHKS